MILISFDNIYDEFRLKRFYRSINKIFPESYSSAARFETGEKTNCPFLWLLAFLGFKFLINDLRFKRVHERLRKMVNFEPSIGGGANRIL